MKINFKAAADNATFRTATADDFKPCTKIHSTYGDLIIADHYKGTTWNAILILNERHTNKMVKVDSRRANSFKVAA